MDRIGAAGAAEAMLVRAAEADTEKSIKLLKKTMAAEQDLVSTLLPGPGQPGSRLDLKA